MCTFVSGFLLVFGGFAHVVTWPGGCSFSLSNGIDSFLVPVLMGVELFSVRGCSVCSVFLVHILVWFLRTYRYISAGKYLGVNWDLGYVCGQLSYLLSLVQNCVPVASVLILGFAIQRLFV